MTEAPTKRLTDEQAELAGEHWERAMTVARHYAKKHPLADLDWESAAAFGLCDAAFRFEPERGLKFWTMAYRRINGAILDMMRQERLKGFGRNCNYEGAPKVESLDRTLGDLKAGAILGLSVKGREITLQHFLPNGDLPTGWEEQSIDSIYGMTKRLASPAKDVVRLYYCHGLTLKQAGERLGFSESRASQLHAQALDFLREAIHPESIAC